MKVKQLIEFLKACDPEATVFAENELDSDKLYPIDTVKVTGEAENSQVILK